MGKRGRPRLPELLTPREQEVLSLIRDGLTNPRIADRLGITIEGVKYHVSEILSKLGVSTREEAAAWRAERSMLGALLAPAALLWRKSHWVAGGIAAVGVATGVAVLVVLLVRSGSDRRPLAAVGETGTGTVPEVVNAVTTPPTLTLSTIPVIPGFDAAYFLDEETGWVSGYLGREEGGVILATRDGGNTWTEVYRGPNPVGQLTLGPLRLGWAVLSSSYRPFAGGQSLGEMSLLQTTDAGETWQTIAELPRPEDVTFLNATSGYAIVHPLDNGDALGDLVTSSDGGKKWSIPRSATYRMRTFCLGDAGHGWASTGSLLLHLADQYMSWEPAVAPDHPEGFSPSRVWCRSASEVWALYIGGNVYEAKYILYRSVDGGASWQTMLDNLASDSSTPAGTGIQSVEFLQSGAVYAQFLNCNRFCDEFGAGPRTMAWLDASGDTWGPELTIGPFRHKASLSFADRNHGWAVGELRDESDSRESAVAAILATSDGGVTWTQQYP